MNVSIKLRARRFEKIEKEEEKGDIHESLIYGERLQQNSACAIERTNDYREKKSE